MPSFRLFREGLLDFIKIGRFCQVDINGRKKSVLVAECADDAWASYLLDRFTLPNNICVQGIPLEEWLVGVAGIKWTGQQFAINFGPFPFTPTEHTIAKIKPMLKAYGDVTKMIFYSDRTITIGFAQSEGGFCDETAEAVFEVKVRSYVRP